MAVFLVISLKPLVGVPMVAMRRRLGRIQRLEISDAFHVGALEAAVVVFVISMHVFVCRACCVAVVDGYSPFLAAVSGSAATGTHLDQQGAH